MIRIIVLSSAAFALAAGAYGVHAGGRATGPAQPDQSRAFPTPATVPTSVTLNVTPAAAPAGAPGAAAPTAVSACGNGKRPFRNATAMFSVCYPETGVATTRGSAAPYPETFTWRSTVEDLFVGISVVDGTPMTTGAVTSLSDLCAIFAKAMGIDFSVETMRVGAADVASCRGHGNAGEVGVDPAYGFVPLKNGQFLQVEIVRGDASPEVQADLDAVLAGVEVQ